MDLLCTKNRARDTLNNAACDTQKLTLLHTGAALAVSLVLTLLNLLLNRQIDTTGGLAGIGTRSVLELLQSVLSLGSSIAIPFWNWAFSLL